MSLPDPDAVPRRQFLRAAVATGGAAALSACLGLDDETTGELSRPAGVDDPASLPARQHAWDDTLATDDDGNLVPPKHHVLLELSLTAEPDETAREQVESALQELESALEWSPDGLLFTMGYTPAYFGRFEEPLPESVDLPEPTTLTELESESEVGFDDYDALVHLASDHASVVLAAEQALLGKREELNGDPLGQSFDGVFERHGRRTGFVGPGLPREKSEEIDIGTDPEHIPEESPFFMGFRSGFARSQAGEDRVTIEEGPFAGGTTEHVESLGLQLRTWFEQDSQHQRVSKMFSPEHAQEERVGEFGEQLGADSGITEEIAARAPEDSRTEGVVGHAQKAARAREDGQPQLLRRDFNTIDDDEPGVHFLSLQENISQFVTTRRAMAGEDLTDGAVGRRLNNGILQYIRVERRGNYLVPPREQRALPNSNPSN